MVIVSNDKIICLNIMYITNKLNRNDGIVKDIKESDYNLVANMQDDENIFNSIFFDKQREVNEMEVKKLSGKNEANNAEPCPRCGNARYHVDKQTRSQDEARSFYIKCGTCGLTVTE